MLIVPKLSCGECTACCSVFSIKELNKPDHTPCVHLSKDEPGCGIYTTRPKECREFSCMWIQGLVCKGKLAYRPDRLGIILTIMDTPPLTNIIGIFREQKYSRLSSKAKTYMRELEKRNLYFFEEAIYGPQDKIDAWMIKNHVTDRTKIPGKDGT